MMKGLGTRRQNGRGRGVCVVNIRLREKAHVNQRGAVPTRGSFKVQGLGKRGGIALKIASHEIIRFLVTHTIIKNIIKKEACAPANDMPRPKELQPIIIMHEISHALATVTPHPTPKMLEN